MSDSYLEACINIKINNLVPYMPNHFLTLRQYGEENLIGLFSVWEQI